MIQFLVQPAQAGCGLCLNYFTGDKNEMKNWVYIVCMALVLGACSQVIAPPGLTYSEVAFTETLSSISADSVADSIYYVGTEDGVVYRYNSTTRAATRWKTPFARIYKVVRDSLGAYWLGTMNNGLCRCRLVGDSLVVERRWSMAVGNKGTNYSAYDIWLRNDGVIVDTSSGLMRALTDSLSLADNRSRWAGTAPPTVNSQPIVLEPIDTLAEDFVSPYKPSPIPPPDGEAVTSVFYEDEVTNSFYYIHEATFSLWRERDLSRHEIPTPHPVPVRCRNVIVGDNAREQMLLVTRHAIVHLACHQNAVAGYGDARPACADGGDIYFAIDNSLHLIARGSLDARQIKDLDSDVRLMTVSDGTLYWIDSDNFLYKSSVANHYLINEFLRRDITLGYLNVDATALGSDTRGHVYVALRDGLWILVGNTLLRVPVLTEARGDTLVSYVTAFTRHGDSLLAATLNDGVLAIDGYTATRVPGTAGHGAIRDVAVDTAGVIHFITDTKLCTLRGDSVTTRPAQGYKRLLTAWGGLYGVGDRGITDLASQVQSTKYEVQSNVATGAQPLNPSTAVDTINCVPTTPQRTIFNDLNFNPTSTVVADGDIAAACGNAIYIFCPLLGMTGTVGIDCFPVTIQPQNYITILNILLAMAAVAAVLLVAVAVLWWLRRRAARRAARASLSGRLEEQRGELEKLATAAERNLRQTLRDTAGALRGGSLRQMEAQIAANGRVLDEHTACLAAIEKHRGRFKALDVALTHDDELAREALRIADDTTQPASSRPDRLEQLAAGGDLTATWQLIKSRAIALAARCDQAADEADDRFTTPIRMTKEEVLNTCSDRQAPAIGHAGADTAPTLDDAVTAATTVRDLAAQLNTWLSLRQMAAAVAVYASKVQNAKYERTTPGNKSLDAAATALRTVITRLYGTVSAADHAVHEAMGLRFKVSGEPMQNAMLFAVLLAGADCPLSDLRVALQGSDQSLRRSGRELAAAKQAALQRLEDIATAHPGSVAALVLATPFRPADR